MKASILVAMAALNYGAGTFAERRAEPYVKRRAKAKNHGGKEGPKRQHKDRNKKGRP